MSSLCPATMDTTLTTRLALQAASLADATLVAAQDLSGLSAQLLASRNKNHQGVVKINLCSSVLHHLHSVMLQIESSLFRTVGPSALLTQIAEDLDMLDGLRGHLAEEPLRRLNAQTFFKANVEALVAFHGALSACSDLLGHYAVLLSMPASFDQSLSSSRHAKFRSKAYEAVKKASSAQVLPDDATELLGVPGQPPSYESLAKESSQKLTGPSLINALGEKNMQAVRDALGAGVNVNDCDCGGSRPLSAAIVTGQLEAVRLLLEAGAEIKDVDGARLPPLFLAAAAGRLDIARVLLGRGADVAQRTPSTRQYFIDVATNNTMAAEFLLQSGADANAAHLSGRALIAVAVRRGDPKLVRLLLQYGAHANVTDLNGHSLLALAMMQNHLDIVRLLLDFSAPVNGCVPGGSTVLMEAMARGHLEVSQLLLDRGANAKGTDIKAQLILLWGIKTRRLSETQKIEAVSQLLQHGASPRVVDITDRRNAIWPAIEEGIPELLRLMLRHGASIDSTANGQTLLLHAMDSGRLDDVRLLLEHGADPNVADDKGRMPLVQAVGKQDTALIELLMEYGANVAMAGRVEAASLLQAVHNPSLLDALGLSNGVQEEARDETPPAYEDGTVPDEKQA